MKLKRYKAYTIIAFGSIQRLKVETKMYVLEQCLQPFLFPAALLRNEEIWRPP